MARLLVVHHSPTRSTQALLESVLAGAQDDAIEGVEVVVRPALEATADDVLDADGYLLGSPVNFGYMSGALKHFFDTVFLSVGGALDPSGRADVSTGSASEGGATTGRPYGLWMHGRYDLTGGVRAVQSIVGALGWKQSYDVLAVLGEVGEEERSAAYELGATIAALLSS
ncbi:flavodoxin family protein [Nocardioides bizhenqiangii]|uniref:NAD(P)H-dependent oxidoreductase n=1 Tax=Nocardioides bizhenqiangii TaxID=3095076 RepID=A0ABZ0ZWL5_9ACTN|nr:MULTISPECIES: NAD(P)H-dependent oxidoreductase [unclassified Nocardioides]MDZ5623258.1 NAD(P)H-dependent oxidoreductase [Nocardioides sp. HM23]WQQ28229.1 NAD(P)H-dependent oxidoreductase [Nocardioides sp. HM61]